MPASLFGSSASVNANASGMYGKQSFTATSGQTVFTLTNFTYTLGTNSLWVFVNGQKQEIVRDFSETSTASFTLVEGCVAGDIVDVVGWNISQITTVPYGATGVGTFAGATAVVITLPTPQPDTNYRVFISPKALRFMAVTARTATTFTVSAAAANTDSFDWMIGR